MKIIRSGAWLALSAGLVLAAGASAQTAPGALRAGAARIDITPPASRDRPRMNQYAHEHLYLRAIVIESGGSRAALIGADLGGINEDVWADASKRVADRLGVPVANVLMSSTHTHSDTAASETPGPGTLRYGSDFIPDVALRAVNEALSNLEPALIGYGTGEAHLNVNRDAVSPVTHLWTQASNLDGPSDKTVAVVSFIRPNREPIAVYVNYAMHPVNGYLAGFVSGDFAGATSRYVEQAFGDDVVTVFSQGASGDQNPRWIRTGTNAMASRSGAEITGYEMVREDIEAPLRSHQVESRAATPEVAGQLADYMQAVGTILGEEVIRVMTSTEYESGNPGIWAEQATLSCPGRRRLGNAREGVIEQYEDAEDVAIRLGAIAIGDIALTSANAEIYSLIGQRVKRESPMSKTVFVTLANGRAASGYIVDDESYGHLTFQALGSRLKPGCAEAGIAAGVAGLLGHYMAR